MTFSLATLSLFLLSFFLFYYLFLDHKETLRRITTREKIVFLTFDDGPNAKETEEILKILEREKIKATFFLVGKSIVARPEIVRKINATGHSLGNHSFSHSYFLPFYPLKKIKKEILETEDLIINLTGKKPALFRPPHGLVSPWMLKTIESLGYRIITWDVMTNDWSGKKKGEDIARDILKKIKPGSIIVLHDNVAERDNAERTETIKALEEIILKLKKRGYQFRELASFIEGKKERPQKQYD